MLNYLTDLVEYLENKEAIISMCRYAEKNGYADTEDWDWRQRLQFWEDCMAHDDWKREEEE